MLTAILTALVTVEADAEPDGQFATGAAASRAVCLCGHGRDAHVHHRSGTDCGICRDGVCGRYRANTLLRRVLGRLLGQIGQVRQPLVAP